MSKVALHIALRADRIEGIVIAANVGPGIYLFGGIKKLTIILRWIPLVVVNATSLILIKIPRN